MKDIEIRFAENKDLSTIVAIYNETIPSRMVTADLTPVTTAERTAWFQTYDPKRRPLWVVTHAQQVIGWFGLEDFYGRPAYQATVEISIYLAAAARGQGLGKYILAFVEKEARLHGIRTILAFIFAHNAASIRLFSRYGYAEWGHLPGVAELDGVARDLAIYGKRIDRTEN